MSLVGNTNEEKIWNYLMSRINNAFGVAGLMGNMQAESGLKSTNLQNTYEKKLGMTDDTYTNSVDNGSYTNFVHDKAGYGLVQFTHYSLKQYLLDFAKKKGKSIGDLEMQLDCVCTQLSEQYNSIWKALTSATSVKEASNVVLLQFERPADQSVSVQEKRAEYGQQFYDKFVVKEEFKMSNSSLVTCTVKSPNHSGKRTHSIDRITPHCVVGQLSASTIGDCFTSPSIQASCNYGIGTEGGVCLIVDEANRSWCSSSNSNDQRAVTIECASGMTAPYAFNNTVYSKLVDLCVDICKRNGKKKLIWIEDKDKALAYNPKSDEMQLTVHRWFANKSCPGDWLFNRMSKLANTVTGKLGGSTTPSTPKEENKNFPATPFKVRVLVSDLNIRKHPKMGDNVIGQTGKGSFTIVKVTDGWGLLKSYADKENGWIYLENSEYVSVVSASSTPSTPKTYKEGDVIKLKAGSTYYNGKTIPAWVFNSTLYYRGKNENGVIFSTLKTGAITGVVKESAIQ